MRYRGVKSVNRPTFMLHPLYIIAWIEMICEFISDLSLYQKQRLIYKTNEYKFYVRV